MADVILESAQYRRSTNMTTAQVRVELEHEIRVALVGKTGVGKSSTANTIAGKELFHGSVGMNSGTIECSSMSVNIENQRLVLIDTPGIFNADKKHPSKKVLTEINRCIHLGAPGLHAIIYVMQIGRISVEDETAIKTFLSFFGEDMGKRGIIAFTHGDKLNKAGLSLKEYLKSGSEFFKNFLKNSGNRAVVFDNESTTDRKLQVDVFMLLLHQLKTTYYFDIAFEKAEKVMELRELKLKKEHEDKIKELTAKLQQQSIKPLSLEEKNKDQAKKLEQEETYYTRRDFARKEIENDNSLMSVLQNCEK